MKVKSFERLFDASETSNNTKLWQRVSDPITIKDLQDNQDSLGPSLMLPPAGKRSNNETGYKDRFFILKGSVLYYAKDTTPKSKIKALLDLSFCYLYYQTSQTTPG